MNCIKDGKYTGDSCFGCNIKIMDCEIRDKVYRNRWIPIDEKLPPLGACVICTVREHFRNQFELRYPVYYLQKTYENGYAFYFGDTSNPLLPDISEVVAWMPMPKPYEEVIE